MGSARINAIRQRLGVTGMPKDFGKKRKRFKEDKDMAVKAEKIVEKLESFASQNINEAVLLTVMKTQKLVKEIPSTEIKIYSKNKFNNSHLSI